MSSAKKTAETLCPVSRAEDLVGDRWTVLVLRELFMGNRRFDEIQAQTGGTPQMVATRLKQMEADDLVLRTRYNERPVRYEYQLTAKGEAFYPVILALRAWGEQWCKAPEEGIAVHFTHRTCGQAAGLGPLCDGCGEVLRREDLIGEQNPVYAEERNGRRESFRAARGAASKDD
ncbi:helix-turn-helix domain-containing protein [Pseudomonas sp. BN606]|uniref:winged helix-turn-helix transcriptional regulator n=1 Tax=Pseudomonas sp. BN606 TaxID=2567894 RepID=UPI002456D26D|nr:helix-turn-helix domain-containing protein [Pseudomonas sp. BN606]MDH4654750.1 helix-turn-helix transcriptional regulator [Pseudomonas sp. BN606]